MLVQEDPTWALDYAHFKRLVQDRAPTDLSVDIWLQSTLDRLAADIPVRAVAAEAV